MHFWYIVGILDTFPAQKYGKHISRHISITTSASYHINISFEKIVLTDGCKTGKKKPSLKKVGKMVPRT